MLMVDDLWDFGCIVVMNVILDIYVMGGCLIMVLVILGMFIDKLFVVQICEILVGGCEICVEVGIFVVGGYFIDVFELIYGLVVIGLCYLQELCCNVDVWVGDVLILIKGLGVGIYFVVIKKGVLDSVGLVEMVVLVIMLNWVGMDLVKCVDVYVIIDVIGFGILGYGLEIVCGLGFGLWLCFVDLFLLGQVVELVWVGFFIGVLICNWVVYGYEVCVQGDMFDWQCVLLIDLQILGGLLIVCVLDVVDEVLGQICVVGFFLVVIIGQVEDGVGIVVEQCGFVGIWKIRMV